ncbi:MAG: sporulation regulator WhiA, partial [Clostridia bacterium]|nr:sporulation regulator WhiA [Clostridia bacterium]
ETIGLDALPIKLKGVAEARLKGKNKTLNELAEILGVTKSCLNHRLRKIIEISENL